MKPKFLYSLAAAVVLTSAMAMAQAAGTSSTSALPAAPGTANAAFEGTVRIVEQLGNSTLTYVDTPAGQIIVEGEGNLQVSPGEARSILIETQNAHLFGADEQVI
jgi:ABC-type sugar transport system ATPase subunit